MQKILQYILPFKLQGNFSDKALNKLYEEWDKPSRQIQISAISFLTAVLYIVFTFMDKSSWLSEDVQTLMTKVYLLGMVPMMLTISFFASKNRFYKYVMFALALSPIVASICHAYIASKITNYSPFLAEGYLSVFWIFIVSGMTLGYALVSAIISSIILLVSTFYLMNDVGIYTTHVFWIMCSFSFGLLGALIFDRSRKTIFMNQQELHRLVITDPLTGVYNRNQLTKVLPQEIGRGVRYNKSFGLLMIDIDNFKRVNDTFGHDIGDKVLQNTAQVLSTFIRKNDTLIRWGGEEFVVMVLEVDQQSLSQFCEKLREQIEAEDFHLVGNITVSVGATLFKENDSSDSLLERADNALYEAKEKGRNRVIYA